MRPAILILATDEHGETRINTDEFNKLTIIQKDKYSSVKIRDNPCKSVAKKIKMRIAGLRPSTLFTKNSFHIVLTF